VEHYYLVQVKSVTEPVLYKDEDSVSWILGHRYPFMVAYVNKREGLIDIHQSANVATCYPGTNVKSLCLMPREYGQQSFLARAPVDLATPTDIELDMGPPILRVDVSAMADLAYADHGREVLQSWIELCYITNKERALQERYRVLRSGGNLVCSEPLNCYSYQRGAGFYHSKDLRGLGQLGERISELMTQRIEEYCKEMIDFTEHDLLEMCWRVGFGEVTVDSDRTVRNLPLNGDGALEQIGWDCRGSATQPTPHEYLAQHLSSQDLEEFCKYVERLFEGEEVLEIVDGGRCLIRAVK